jgi:uncharacterized protein
MGSLMIAGYASLFGVVDLAGDVVATGAFTASLKDWPVTRIPMLMQHDPSRKIGVWDRLDEDDVGLWAQGRIDASFPGAAQAAAMVRSETMRGLSIGFRTRASVPRHGGGRVLREVALREVSLVAFPMLPGARLRLISPTAHASDLAGPAQTPPQTFPEAA